MLSSHPQTGRFVAITPPVALIALIALALASSAGASTTSGRTADVRSGQGLVTASVKKPAPKPSRVERGDVPAGIDISCPGGKVDRIVDCPEMVCPCQRGRNVVLARAHDPKTGCCNTPSCDRICSERNRCPRFTCPCGVPGDLAAATDDATGKCISDQKEVCRRACKP